MRLTENVAFISLGSPEADAAEAENIERRERLIVEGLCPNRGLPVILEEHGKDCGAMLRADEEGYEATCPNCGYVGFANTPMYAHLERASCPNHL